MLTSEKSTAANWAQLVLGLWIVLSPWLLGFSSITVMKWSNLIAGTVIFLVNVWAIFGEKQGTGDMHQKAEDKMQN